MTSPPSFLTRKRCFALFLVTCLASSSLFVGSANARSGPSFKENSCRLSPFNVNSSPLGNTQPYLAGYMTTDLLSGDPGDDRAKQVRVTVSFSGTDKSVIQSENILAAGIAAQGPDMREGFPGILPYIDWGYALLLVLDGSEDQPYIQGIVWKCYEWGRPGDYPWNPLDPPVADLISSWTWSYPGVLTIDATVTLTMSWGSTQLLYQATIGGVEYLINIYQPEEGESNYFMLGTCNRDYRGLPLDGTVKWFQFPGAWSYYNIGTIGWYSHVRCPSFRKEGETEWRPVRFAYSVDGPNSWMDNTMAWGGSTYGQVGADYWSDHVYFHYTSDGNALAPDTLLWEPPAEPIGTIHIKADGSIDPPSAPIQRNGNIYTLTGDVYNRIVVEKNDILVDGAGHTVQGDGTASGMDLSDLTGVTIYDMVISTFDCGIYLANSSNCKIIGNILTSNYYGIWLFASSNNRMIGNNLTANIYGIGLTLSSIGNNLFYNNFQDNNAQACCDTQSNENFWDDGYPAGGNYWSDYNGVDSDYDGIGDTPYTIESNNQDDYPLMNQWIQKIGDVNFDGKVDVKDLYAVGRAYGTSLQGPNPQGRYYDPYCDLNNDNEIDVRDILIVGLHYGE